MLRKSSLKVSFKLSRTCVNYKKAHKESFFACIVRIDALEYPTGEMAEWSNAFDLKSNVVKATEGSNPSLSVNKQRKLPSGSFLCNEVLLGMSFCFSHPSHPHLQAGQESPVLLPITEDKVMVKQAIEND